MRRSDLVRRALMGLLVAGVSGSAGTGWAAPHWAEPGDELEKCAGLVKTGENDCGAKGHICSGRAAKDNDPEEWGFMPKGICEKLAGGKVVGSMTVK